MPGHIGAVPQAGLPARVRHRVPAGPGDEPERPPGPGQDVAERAPLQGRRRKLARVGLARKDWEGPEDYARRVALARPELGHGLAAITALYIDLRYGRLSGTEARRKLRRLVADLKISSRR